MFQKWFQDLYEDRLENARVLSKDSMRGVKDAVSDKYSDSAHFIYELLQNADDVGATRAEFELLEDRLIFKHNGTRHFSITDPATEKDDKTADAFLHLMKDFYKKVNQQLVGDNK